MTPDTHTPTKSAGSGSRLKRMVVSVLAILGAIFLFAIGGAIATRLGLLPRLSSSWWVVKVIPSPDGDYKAIIFNDNGGGGFAPYCFDSVSVAPVGISDKDADRDKYSVYSGSCHVIGKCGTNAPIVRWSSNSTLEVTFDPTLAAENIRQLEFRSGVNVGSVRVVYRQFNSEDCSASL
jgi:hypothetical protein